MFFEGASEAIFKSSQKIGCGMNCNHGGSKDVEASGG